MPPRRKRPLSGAAKAAHERKMRRPEEETAAPIQEPAPEPVEQGASFEPAAPEPAGPVEQTAFEQGAAELEEAAGEATGKGASSKFVVESEEGPSPEPPKSPIPPTPDDDMNDYPRQEDWRQRRMPQENQPNMEISELDVHTILAFASLVREGSMTTYNMERRNKLDNQAEPKKYAVKQPWRLAKCLDSLANISVSKERGEVIAVAIRYDDENAEIMVAGNDDIPDETIEYLKNVWELLRQISAALHGDQEYDSTPTDIKKQHVQDLVRQYELEVIKFTYARIQKKLFGKPHNFDSSIPLENDVKQAVENLRQLLRENNEAKPKERLDDEDWTLVHDHLENLPAKSKNWQTTPEGIPKSKLGKYVGKIAGIAADIHNLRRAACSPHYKDVFNLTPLFTPLEQETTTIPSCLTTLEEWEMQMQRPLSFYNSTKGENLFANDIFQSYCYAIAHKRFHQAPPVHCEVKLALHVFNKDGQSTSPKAATYPYIGVSKLSCVGCNHFLSAFNSIHHTNFVTKGQHSKAYYPWGFPGSCPQSQEVLKNQYETLTSWFVNWYTGYAQSLGPDSTAQSDPSGSAVIRGRTDKEIVEKQQKKYKPTVEDVEREE